MKNSVLEELANLVSRVSSDPGYQRPSEMHIGITPLRKIAWANGYDLVEHDDGSVELVPMGRGAAGKSTVDVARRLARAERLRRNVPPTVDSVREVSGTRTRVDRSKKKRNRPGRKNRRARKKR